MLKEHGRFPLARSHFYIILVALNSHMVTQFHKYHGTGNDFILIDNTSGSFAPDQKTIAGLCDRHFGIGADGLILLNKASGYNFGMTYFNSDGRESTMCGNGGRCLMAFADFLSLTDGKSRFLAIDGPHDGEILGKEGDRYQVRIRMADVVSFRDWNGMTVIDTGSPHLVCRVNDAMHLNILETARPLRYHQEFAPSGINVNFVEDLDDHLYVRSYERGVEDETLSCGTGVTAAALAHALGKESITGRVTIHTRGGILHVSFKKTPGGFEDIWLEGPSQRVFEGTIDTGVL